MARGWPKGKPRKVVGGEVRADAAVADVQQLWQTDLVSPRPGFKRQFMRENEVRDRGRSKTVLDRDTGEQVRVSGWQIVTEDDAGMTRERPDLGSPTDTVARMGPHVLMEIPEADWDMLQHEKDAVPDALAERLMNGRPGDPSTTEFIKHKQEKFLVHPALMGGMQEG